MKVKVKIIKTHKGLQAFCIQEGRSSDNLIESRSAAKNLATAKTEIFTKLRNCEVEVEFGEGVEE